MAIKIRVSYESDKELGEVIRLLRPVLIDCKIMKNIKGRYKRAYITIHYPTYEKHL